MDRHVRAGKGADGEVLSFGNRRDAEQAVSEMRVMTHAGGNCALQSQGSEIGRDKKLEPGSVFETSKAQIPRSSLARFICGPAWAPQTDLVDLRQREGDHRTTRDSGHILLSGFSGMRHRVCVHIRVQFQGQSSLHVFKSGDAGGRGRS